MDVADLREQMVFDLIVQTTDEPRQQSIPWSEVDRRFDLMSGERIVNASVFRHGKRHAFDAVSDLEHNAECNALEEGDPEVRDKNVPRWMEHHRDHEREDQEDQLPAEEYSQIPAFGSRNRMNADATSEVIAEVIIKLPLDRDESIQEPQVQMLNPMDLQTRLMRRQSSQHAEFDIVVMACDVGVCVVDRVVLASPVVRTAAENVETHRGQFVDDGIR